MAKAPKTKKAPAKAPTLQKSYSPEAQEMRALLRRVPDGLRATLTALGGKDEAARDRVLNELARGMGKEVMPLFKAAAASSNDGLSCSAVRILPAFGTRAAADILAEVHQAHPGTERAKLAAQGARALLARGISVSIPMEEAPAEAPKLSLRETCVSVPDGVGSRSIAARLQDQYGVWHAIFVLWNDQVGIRDGFMRQMSRSEWTERLERADQRGFAWVPCPADYARWQVAQGRSISDAEGVREALKDWDEQVGAAPDGYDPPCPWSGAAKERKALVERSGDLFTVPEAQRWFLEAADCTEFARKLSDLRVRSRLRRADDDLKAEFEELTTEATEALITPEQRKLYRDRVMDLARALAWRGEDEQAHLAAAVALDLDAKRPCAEIPFFRKMVDRSLQAAEALLLRGEDLEKLRYRPGKRLARRA